MAMYAPDLDKEFRAHLEKFKGRKELKDIIKTTLFLLEGPKDVWDVPEEGIYQEERWTPFDYARWYWNEHALAARDRFQAHKAGALTTAQAKRERRELAIKLFDPKVGSKAHRGRLIQKRAEQAEKRGEFEGSDKLPRRLDKYLD